MDLLKIPVSVGDDSICSVKFFLRFDYRSKKFFWDRPILVKTYNFYTSTSIALTTHNHNTTDNTTQRNVTETSRPFSLVMPKPPAFPADLSANQRPSSLPLDQSADHSIGHPLCVSQSEDAVAGVFPSCSKNVTDLLVHLDKILTKYFSALKHTRTNTNKQIHTHTNTET